MPTAILDLDLEKLPREIAGLERYDRALALLRFRGCPVGKANLKVAKGIVFTDDSREELFDAAGELPWELWLQDYLDWHSTRPESKASVTVAVCTRERTTDLAYCLSSLDKLRERPDEILVIDNAPQTQKTRDLVTGFFPNVRYLCEPRAGLDNARNRALAEATSEVVAFIDDDAVADRDWVKGLLCDFADPMVTCVTGLTMPLELETPAQEWFEQHCPFGKGFRRKIFKADSHDPLRTGEIGAGVNMAVRRTRVLELGGFDPDLDAGTPTQSGGDHEMFSRILAAGFSIVYEPAALSWHRHRRSWKELRRAFYGYGVGVYALLTRTIVVEREWAAVKIATGWFRHNQFPKLLRAVFRRPNCEPLDLLLSELHGCCAGPFAYLRSRKLRLEGGVS
jgi:glycosyltransferase involved in cell wall biosynthesis